MAKFRVRTEEDTVFIYSFWGEELMFKVMTKEGAEINTIRKKPCPLQLDNKKNALNVARQSGGPYQLQDRRQNV